MKPIAVVTGASRGIGAAIARTLASLGFAVCVNYQQAQDKADEVVRDIQQQGGEAFAVKADMSLEQDIKKLFETVDETLGPVTALINNAGTNGGICEVEQITSDRLQSVFSTNVFGPFLCAREAIKRMKNRGGGNIVNISSEAAKFGVNKMAHYSSSKAALNIMSIALAREVAPYRIRVNVVSPGVIDTEMHHGSPPDRIANLLKTLPMGRMGTPEEVAELVAWLLSDKASYVSGAIMSVNGSR